MRIVIDMQGAQTESRFRGIGRYTLAFAHAVVRNSADHEIFLALNGLFPETIEPIRASFDGLLPQENIRVWEAPGPTNEESPHNVARREVAELLREAFLASLEPDIIHVTSLFEGYIDSAATSIGRFDTTTPVSVTLYDLIPLLNPEQYLFPHPNYGKYYARKVEFLKKASLCLAISEYACHEASMALPEIKEKSLSVSTAITDNFVNKNINEEAVTELREKYGLNRSFVLYTGGSDERKNLPRLIKSYAQLPSSLREEHQLTFAGRMPQSDIDQLKSVAKKVGLNNDELIFTGYISDDELVILYNTCKLYVFPSWHEGFGLPALEAMACGAPVIGANTSSLPEVIGLSEALFDPFDVQAITTLLIQALQDERFRNRLREHSPQQAQQFSWDKTAQRAIVAWEDLLSQKVQQAEYFTQSLGSDRLLKAIASHIDHTDHTDHTDEPNIVAMSHCIAQNESSGIERQVLVDVSELCQRDAATGIQRVVRSYLNWLLKSPPAGFRIEPVYATRTEGYRYARQFTQRFLGCNGALAGDGPVRWQRGDLFFGLDMQHHVQLAHKNFYRQLVQDGVVVKFLVHDLLPIQLASFFKDSNAKELHEQWLAMVAASDGAICVSKSTADALDSWVVENAIPRAQAFRSNWVHSGADIESSQPSRGLPDDATPLLQKLNQRPTFLCVSTVEPRKGQQQILEAIDLLWKCGTDINLVFIGQQGWKVETFAERLRDHSELDARLFWLQGISDEYLNKVYGASTCLIAASVNEGFGLSLIEAARHGIPIVARDIPVFREVAGEYADYFEGETLEELAEALNKWLVKFDAGKHTSSKEMPWSTWQESTEKLKTALVKQNYPRRQLLVDISELVQRDAKTGIQRVVNAVLSEWLLNPPEGFRVRPVYATVEQGYHYADQFIQKFLSTPRSILKDEPIEYGPGDVFFALDLAPSVQTVKAGFYQHLRNTGVTVKFLVHDLLCIQQPRYFLPGTEEGFSRWLNVVGESDGAVCVSKNTAESLSSWMSTKKWQRFRKFECHWNHNGVEVKGNIGNSAVVQPDDGSVLPRINGNDSFLMVSTIEPRKGHSLVLDAFECLWQYGSEFNLVMVGKQGWMVEQLVERLRNHPQLNKRLFWLEGISDEYLGKIYAASTCLVAASYEEGFGLPLIEAARHKLPIVARDIPVFREVADVHAFYFNSEKAEGLAQALQEWMELYQKDMHPRSDAMPWLTWKESADQLLKLIIPNQKSGCSIKKEAILENQ
jgi:glycosyltransferase involved in cell wall biosynthesis